METGKKKTLVLGASDSPARYSYLALNRLREQGYPVEGIGARNVRVADVEIGTEKRDFPEIDTVSIYLNPIRQEEYYDYIVSLHPRRVIFNPGAENEELERLTREHGIQAVEACTLVLLSTGQF